MYDSSLHVSQTTKVATPRPGPSLSGRPPRKDREDGKFFLGAQSDTGRLEGPTASTPRLLSAQLRPYATSLRVDRGLRGSAAAADEHSGKQSFGHGFTVMLLSVSAGMHSTSGGFGLLVGFTGVLAGIILIAGGVRMADHPAPTIPFAFGGARALAAFMRRNTAAVGLLLASGAVTVVSGKAEPVLCFGIFTLLLLAVSLINIGVRGE